MSRVGHALSVLAALVFLIGCQNAGDIKIREKNGSTGNAASGKPFVTVWRVQAKDPVISIPADPSYVYRYTVEWGDDQIDSDIHTSITHTYSSAGEYTVKISGAFPHLYMSSLDNPNTENKDESNNAEKLLRVNNWGEIVWKDMGGMFASCLHVEINASSRPNLSQVHSMHGMFANAEQFNSDICGWDVSTVTDMGGMFANASAFDQPLNCWDVSRATDMGGMFMFAVHFNQSLSDWNVSSVTEMDAMFEGAAKFDQPLGSWDVSHVTSMSSMFEYARTFNQSLDGWDVSHVTDMSSMFRFAKSFHDQDLSRWDLSQVKKRKNFLKGAGTGNILPSLP